jgi:hypothetical protein
VICERCQQELPASVTHIPYPFPGLTGCLPIMAFTSAECPAWEDGKHYFVLKPGITAPVSVGVYVLPTKSCCCGTTVELVKT